LRDKGFRVTTEYVSDLIPIKINHGITPDLAGCHTAVVEGYVIEGHVPAREIHRLLEERDSIAGLSVPGMPVGSPGMEGAPAERYQVLAFDRNGRREVYASY
jgi:hypothetical protein